MSDFLLPNFENIPLEIQQNFRWAVWKAEPRANKPGKFNKAPRSPITGRNISVNKPESFSSYEVCQEAYKKGNFTGVGILLQDNDWVGIDIDDLYQIPQEQKIEIEKWIQKAFAVGAYIERSPSSRGLRVLIKGTFEGNGKKKGALEIYKSQRFLTITGCLVKPDCA